MKTIKFFMLVIMIISYGACQKCEPIEIETCGDPKPNGEYCGWTVATCYSEDPAGDVGVVFDTRYNSAAPIGDDWNPSLPDFHPANWKANLIGQIFGIATDEASNIYLASSDIYFSSGSPSSNAGRPNPSGRIFKCLPPTWNAATLVDLPNTGDPLNGIGNIAYDRWNDQLFATNLEDGKIYRVSTNSAGILETYDPWTADIGTPGIATKDERIWGIGVNKEGSDIKIYFPRVTGSTREIFSITLLNGAFPSAGSEVLEISNLPGTQEIISDLAFSSNGSELLIAERGDPHAAKVQSYSLIGNVWNYNQQYFVGAAVSLTDGENSAGGVDFAYTEINRNVNEICDEYFWASGNYMLARNSSLNLLYGLEGIAYSGNNSSSAPTPFANQDTDLFIDFDGLGGTSSKGTIGDVEVFDCLECLDPCALNDIAN